MSDSIEEVSEQLDQATTGSTLPKVSRAMMAYLSGIIGLASGIAGDVTGTAGTIAGGLIAAGASAWSEHDQDEINKLFKTWLKMQQDEIKEIGITLIEVIQRVDYTDEHVRARIESPEYLKLIKKCFRDWSAAESEEKRILIRNLLVNAAAPERPCKDDVIRMFIKWIDYYSEAHFKIIEVIFHNPLITRKEIWDRIYKQSVREDSAEADLFKLLVSDLSTGHVIHQYKEKDGAGNIYKTKNTVKSRYNSPFMTSAFEDTKEYELTELGKQFVHFAMTETVPKIAAPIEENK